MVQCELSSPEKIMKGKKNLNPNTQVNPEREEKKHVLTGIYFLFSNF